MSSSSETGAERITFRGIVRETIDVFERMGYDWDILVTGFWTECGIPPLDMFSDVAIYVAECHLSRLPREERKRLYRSRHFRDWLLWHYEGDLRGLADDEIAALYGRAVWQHIYTRAERDYIRR